MSSSDKTALDAAGKAWTEANKKGDQAGMEAAHQRAESIRAQYGYSGGGDGSGYHRLPSSSKGGGGGGSKGTGSSMGNAQLAGMSALDRHTLDQIGKEWGAARDRGDQAGMEAAHRRAESIRAKYGYSGGGDGSEFIRLPGEREEEPAYGPVNQPNPMKEMLDSWLQAAQKQQQEERDRAVEQGTQALKQAEAQAQEQFQTQQNINDRDERKALDNQALYAEARGDRGGIGQAQYGQIQAQAMENRQTINSAQTKLATDTARQIADLRAQGEFEKADGLLKLTQEYLGKLMQLYQWNSEHQLSQDKFYASMQQWQQDFDMKVGQMMGSYGGKPTLEAQKGEHSQLAKMGMAALQQGIRPSPAQQQAMGYTDAQINGFLQEYENSKKPAPAPVRPGKGSGSSGGSGGRGNGGSGKGSGRKPAVPEKSEYYKSVRDRAMKTERSEGIGRAGSYLTRMVRGGFLTMDEAATVFRVDLGGTDAEWMQAVGVANEHYGSGDKMVVLIPDVGRLSIDMLNKAIARGQVIRTIDPATGKFLYTGPGGKR